MRYCYVHRHSILPAMSCASLTTTALPAPLASLLKWAQEQQSKRGVPIDATVPSGTIPGAPLVCVREIEGQGYALVAARDITGSEEVELLRSTPDMQMRVEACVINAILPPDDPWLAFSLMILYELSLGTRSKFAAYLASLPKVMDMPFLWTPEQKAELAGCTFLGQRMEFFEWDTEWNERVQPFIQQHPAEFDSNICTKNTWLRTQGWILSRAFRPKGYPGNFADVGPHLLPLIDLANTTSMKDEEGRPGINTKVEWVWPLSASASTSSLAASAAASSSSAPVAPSLVLKSLVSSHPIRAGAQLFIPYGSTAGLSNTDLLVRYGFVEGLWQRSENELDFVAIDLKRVVELVHGHTESGVPAVAAGEDTEKAHAREDEEARDLRRIQKARADAHSRAREEEHMEEDDGSESDSSACGGASPYQEHLALVESLPFSSVNIPFSGVLPEKLLLFLGVLTGEVSSDVFGHISAREDWEQRKEEVLERRKRVVDHHAVPSAAIPAAASSSSPSPPPIGSLAVASPIGHASSHSSASSPSPPPSQQLDPVLDADLLSEEQELAFTLPMCRAISQRTLVEVMKSPDVYTHCFLVLHSALERYSTTLEEDVELLKGLEARNGQEGPSNDDSRRMLLALRVRLSEKRIIHRALAEVKETLAEWGAFDSDQEDDDLGSDTPQPMQLVQQALRDAGETDEGDSVQIGSEHQDPNIVDPAFLAMLSNQQRPSRGNKRQIDVNEDDEENPDEIAEIVSPVHTKFTYTKSTSGQPKKKRRG